MITIKVEVQAMTEDCKDPAGLFIQTRPEDCDDLLSVKIMTDEKVHSCLVNKADLEAAMAAFKQ